MAVSYVSKVIQPTQYISPYDAGLVQKALLFSQQKFDQGVERTQQDLNRLNSKEILHESHRQYYEQKMADVTNQINSLGGADFGDRNVVSQISGLSGIISNDDRIVQAEADTRSIKNLMGTYQKWQQDPKLSKLYATQNERWSMDKVSKYLSDQAPDAQYRGSKSAVAYFDYKAVMGKELQNRVNTILKTHNASPTGTGYIIEGQQVSRREVENMAQMQINADPRIQQQIGIDAWASGDVIRQRPNEFRTQKAAEYSRAADGQMSQRNQRATDLDAEILLQGDKAKKLALQNRKLKELADMDAGINQLKQKSSTYLNPATDLENLIHSSFIDNYVQGLGSEFSFSSTKVTPDAAFAAAQRQNLSERQFGFQQNKFKLEFERQQNQWGAEFKYNAEKDKLDFQLKEKQLAVSASKQVGMKQDKDGKWKIDTPDLTPVDQPNNPDSVISHDLESFKGVTHEMVEDQYKNVQGILVEYLMSSGQVDLATELKKKIDILPHKSGDARIGGLAHTKGLSPTALKSFMGIVNDYDHYVNTGEVRGSLNTMLKSPKSRELWQSIQLNDAAIKINSQKIKSVEDQVSRSVNLTAEEKSFMALMNKQKAQNPDLFNSVQSDTDFSKKRYNEIMDRYTQANEVASQQMGKEGLVLRAYLVSGEDLKDKYSALQTIVLNRIRNQAVSPEGRNNSEFQKLVDSKDGKMQELSIAAMRIDPFSKQVEVSLKSQGEDKVNYESPFIKVDFAGSTDWLSTLPHELQQNQANRAELMIQDHYSQEGNFKIGSKWLEFRPTSGPAISFSAMNRNGIPQLLYRFNGEMKMVPDQLRALVPDSFNRDPLSFMKGQALTDWMTKQIAPILTAKYGMDPATGKVKTGFVPTIAHFNQYIESLP